MQVEVADKVGMTHSVYKAIEEGFTQHIEPDKVDRLAQFYGVPVTDFLDEFNHFLYDGQAVRIRTYRESFGMGKKPFARKMGERQKGYQLKMLGTAFQRQGITET